MFDADHYVPVLRTKQAEFEALRDAPQSVRDAMTPLLETPPVESDEDDDNVLSPDPVLKKLAVKIEGSWGHDRPFFLDLGMIPSVDALGGGRHPVAYVFDEARSGGLQAIPVTNPGADDKFQAAVKGATDTDGRGVCIRLTSDDVQDLGTTMDDCASLLDDLALDRGDADLVLDFGAVPGDQAGPLTLAAAGVIAALSNIGEWRTLTWTGTSFPNVQPFQANSINTAPRSDWSIYQALRSRSLQRQPAFGDYTVNGVQTMGDMSAAYYRSSPNLRYTTETDYLVLKARHPKHGHDQFNDLCRVMVARPEFRGAAFSSGDTYVEDCANGKDGPGNATTWRRAGVAHHLATAVYQLATLGGP